MRATTAPALLRSCWARAVASRQLRKAAAALVVRQWPSAACTRAACCRRSTTASCQLRQQRPRAPWLHSMGGRYQCWDH